MLPNYTEEIKLEITSIRVMTSRLLLLDWNFAMNDHTDSSNLKVRVTMKTKIQTYKNEDGSSGIYCFIYLKDQSGEIGAVLFNKECDKYYDKIKTGKVYTISNQFKVRETPPRYRNPKNDFEIIFRLETEFEEVEDDGSIPYETLGLLPISKIYNLRQNESVNTIGICTEMGKVEYFNRNDGKPRIKRDIILEDRGDSIKVTLWGERAEIWPIHFMDQAILLMGSHYNYRTLEVSYQTAVIINPDIPEKYYLKN